MAPRRTKYKLIKICLVNDGEDAETPWAQDLGPADGPPGSRKARIVNVPFLHAKPTWGDVVVVSPDTDDEDALLTWDAKGVAFSKIGTRILEDSGRYAMIVDYKPRKDDPTGDIAFAAIAKACEVSKKLETNDIVCEGAYGPDGKTAGRIYMAVKDALEPADVMAQLDDAEPPATLIQVHPAIRKAKPKAKAKAKPAKPKARAKKK
jgi:hypothetical protein